MRTAEVAIAITNLIDFMGRATYFRFFIASNLFYCNFLKFLMVTEEWNPAVRARS